MAEPAPDESFIDWDAIEDADDFVAPSVEPDAEKQQPSYTEPDASFAKSQGRPRGAIKYENKVRGILQIPFRAALGQKSTVPDAAALFLYGPKVSEKWGDLAATNDAIARGIDWLTEGSESVMGAAFIATVPLVLQGWRNHEPQLENANLGFPKFWLRKDKDTGKRPRFTVRFRLKMSKRAKLWTNDPDSIAEYVFTNPSVVAAMKKQKLTVPGYIE